MEQESVTDSGSARIQTVTAEYGTAESGTAESGTAESGTAEHSIGRLDRRVFCRLHRRAVEGEATRLRSRVVGDRDGIAGL